MAQPVEQLSCGMNDPVFNSWKEKEIFSFPRCLDWLWSQPASYLMGTEFFPWVKKAGA
jgi:hypothetical protein